MKMSYFQEFPATQVFLRCVTALWRQPPPLRRSVRNVRGTTASPATSGLTIENGEENELVSIDGVEICVEPCGAKTEPGTAAEIFCNVSYHILGKFSPQFFIVSGYGR